MEEVLEENGLKEFIDQDIPNSTTSDANDLPKWKKCVAKARKIILVGVMDHIVSSLQGNEIPYAMWKELMNLFQSRSDHRKLALKKKFKKIKMEKGDSILKYLTKFTHC